MREDIRLQLEAMAEKEYMEFSKALIPGAEQMLGVRLPKLRVLAKEIAREDWEGALEPEDIYFEETMLRGMVLGYAVKQPEQLYPLLGAFIPRITNWSVCDSVLNGMKTLQKDREATWKFVLPYLESDKEFEVRVALVIMMQHLLKCDAVGNPIKRRRRVEIPDLVDENEETGQFTLRILKALDRPFHQGYYASMAAAWLLCECFCTFPYHTMELLQHTMLDKTTYDKGIRKMLESRIPSDEVKAYLRKTGGEERIEKARYI